MIPTKIVVTGDMQRGKGLIGLARGQLSILKKDMSFQKLNEGFRTVKPFEDVVIECWSGYSLDVVNIHVLEDDDGGASRVSKSKREEECFCIPHFSWAIILAVYPPSMTDDQKVSAKYSYDLEICNLDSYLLYEGMYPPNWERYFVGQYVLVTVGESMESWTNPLHCDRKCLVDRDRFETLTIAPIYAMGNMSEIVPEIIEE